MAHGSGPPTAIKLRGFLLHPAVRYERLRNVTPIPTGILTPRDGGDPGHEGPMVAGAFRVGHGGSSLDETAVRRELVVS